ncbi:MAG: ATP-binding protein [Oscillospiraceae bacterium]|nr:ATP-binding protein [Oscillospiraceae bacterium]
MKHLKFIFILIFIISILSSDLSITAVCEDNNTITVGYLDLQNFISTDKNGEYYGTGCEYLKEIAMYTGWNYRFEKVSIDTCIEKLRSGEIDLFTPIQKTSGRVSSCLYSKNYIIKGTPVLVTGVDSKYCFNDFENYSGMKIGYARSDICAESLREILSSNGCSVEYYEYDTTADVDKALRNGEIDSEIVDSYQCINNCRILLYLSDTYSYIVCDSSRSDLMNKLDYAMDEIIQNNPDIYDNFDKKYGTQNAGVYPSFTAQEKSFISSHKTICAHIDACDVCNSCQTTREEKLLDKISELTGLEFTVCKETADSDKISSSDADIILTVNHDYMWAKNNDMRLTNTFLNSPVYLVRKTNNNNIRKIAVVENSFLAFELSKRNDIELLYCKDDKSCIDMVFKSEADASYCSEFVRVAYSSLPRYHSLSFIQSYEYTNNYAIGISGQCDILLVSILNKTLSCISQNDIISIYSTDSFKPSLGPLDMIRSNPLMFTVIISVIAVIFVFAVLMTVFTVIIRRKNVELIRAVNAKQNFLSNISHELRTPVSAIIGLNEMQLASLDDIETVRDCADKIHTSSEHLISLINSVLDISRINSGKTVIETKPFDLKKTVMMIDTVYQQIAVKNKVRLITQCGIDSQTFVIGDELRLKEVIINLISNAVKYNKTNGTVKFIVSVLDTAADRISVRFEVSDTGIGIPEAQLEDIFKPFERGAQYTHSSIPGTGLGLAISEGLIKQMGSKLRAASIPDQGSLFWFELSFERCTVSDTSKNTQPGSKSSVSVAQIPDLSGLHILIAEDNEINRAIIRHLLIPTGCSYVFADNGRQACEMFEQSELYYYSSILMDIRMPEMDGYEASDKIRSLCRDDAKSVHIIALSANAFNEDIRASLSHGMNSHITKPVDKVLLYNELNKCRKI